ncbi:MAG: hypothetical protein KAT79_04745 [candidate division Zixibacteria bacterium]|nr:hypothetical protein [candidate division Zixibacteria bacterium]
MEGHVKAVGVIYIALGVLSLLGAILFFMVLAAGAVAAGDQETTVLYGLVGTVIGLVMGVLSVPGIIAGWALLKQYEWGRIFGLILAFLNLINIPFGTIFGVYAIWVLIHRETVQLFDRSVPPQPTPGTQ